MAGKKAFHELHFADAFMFAAAMEDEGICRGVHTGIPLIPDAGRQENRLVMGP